MGLDTGTARERHVSERRMRVCPAVARDCVCVSGVWWEVATFSGYDLLGSWYGRSATVIGVLNKARRSAGRTPHLGVWPLAKNDTFALPP